jgi:HAD superfamily hydrolase (TIGR01509 family)
MKCASAENIFARNHWVFDLDGTLTVAVHDFDKIRTRLDIPPGSDILGHLNALPPNASRLLHATLQEIEDELAGMTTAASGAFQLLENLQSRGASLGILTRNTRNNALRTLALVGLDSFFNPDHILGRDEAKPKPDPDGIFHLAHRWNTGPEAAVMVGDYLYDLQAGRSAGAATIHVDFNRDFRWPELADITAATLQELDDMLNHLNENCAGATDL